MRFRIRQHAAPDVDVCTYAAVEAAAAKSCMHTSAYVSIRQHAGSACMHTSACFSGSSSSSRATQAHTSAYVSSRQHTSAYVSIRQVEDAAHVAGVAFLLQREQLLLEKAAVREHLSTWSINTH